MSETASKISTFSNLWDCSTTNRDKSRDNSVIKASPKLFEALTQKVVGPFNGLSLAEVSSKLFPSTSVIDPWNDRWRDNKGLYQMLVKQRSNFFPNKDEPKVSLEMYMKKLYDGKEDQKIFSYIFDSLSDKEKLCVLLRIGYLNPTELRSYPKKEIVGEAVFRFRQMMHEKNYKYDFSSYIAFIDQNLYESRHLPGFSTQFLHDIDGFSTHIKRENEEPKRDCSKIS